VKEQVAERIRLERLRLNLSQQNIADELGITVAAYSNLERGVTEISINRLFKIAELLAVPINNLLSKEVGYKPQTTTIQNVQESHVGQQLYMVIKEVKHLSDELEKMKVQISEIKKKN
jgi:transcriptional regulator with XRE-family HTH domain